MRILIIILAFFLTQLHATEGSDPCANEKITDLKSITSIMPMAKGDVLCGIVLSVNGNKLKFKQVMEDGKIYDEHEISIPQQSIPIAKLAEKGHDLVFCQLFSYDKNIQENVWITAINKKLRKYPSGDIKLEKSEKMPQAKGEVLCGIVQSVNGNKLKFKQVMEDGKIYDEHVISIPRQSIPIAQLAQKGDDTVFCQLFSHDKNIQENAWITNRKNNLNKGIQY